MDFPFRAVVFDLDGVIVETEEPIYESYQTILAEYGLPLPISVWEDVIGRGGAGSRDGVCDYLETSLGIQVDRDALRERARIMHRERTQTLPARDGVREHIQAAKEAGLRLGVASSSSQAWVEGHLSRLGLLAEFDTVCVREDVQQTKPHPDLYMLSLERLDAAPNEAFAIEDSPNGITAAKAAGMQCVVAPNPLTIAMSLDHADLRVESLADVSFAELVAALAGQRPAVPPT